MSSPAADQSIIARGERRGRNRTLQITTTNDPADPLAWRQWHRWNLASQLFKVRLSNGKNVLTVHKVTNGNMNLAYFEFKPPRE
jgi:hypothetical protein